MSRPSISEVTIPSSGSASGAQFVPTNKQVVGLIMPAAWTSAKITFQASVDGINYGSLRNANGEVQLTVGANQFLALNPADYDMARYLKVISGVAGSGVNQSAARTIGLVMK